MLKSYMTFSEARAAAFKQFPVRVDEYAVSWAAAEDCEFARLVAGLLTVNSVFVDKPGNPAEIEVVKPTRGIVLKALIKLIEKRDEGVTMDHWANTNRMVRYVIDDLPHYESWDRGTLERVNAEEEKHAEILRH